jgi:hypothetical protein
VVVWCRGGLTSRLSVPIYRNMAHLDFGLTDSELTSIAVLSDCDAQELRTELSRRPWALHDILSAPELVDAVLKPKSLLETPDAFALFAVLVRLAADELLLSSYFNDWTGPGTRLPLFDVAPVQEFVSAPGRVLFVARLLTSMVAPVALPAPIPTSDPWELIDWLASVDDTDRVVLLRRLGDLSLFVAGVQADAHGSEILSSAQAAKAARQLGMTCDEVLDFADPASLSPGLDALEKLGARWYEKAMSEGPTTPPVLGDIAQRIHAARQFLTHLTDRFFGPFESILGIPAAN